MSRRILQRVLSLIPLVFLLLGCGGGGGKSTVVNPISGTITTTSYAIPASETRTVVGDLTVKATDGITLDGTLLVQPGASVSLFTDGDLTINGAIKAAGGAALTRVRGTEPEAITLCGQNVRVIEPTAGKIAVETGPGVDVVITTLTDTGTVTINGQILTGNGQDATAGSVTTMSGGSLYIGNAYAVQKATEQWKGTSMPGTVVVNANLRMGHGGIGYSESGHTSSTGRDFYVNGTSGGAGGSVVISAKTKIEIAEGVVIRAGDGSPGGGGGTVAAPLHAPDGVAVGEVGYRLSALIGNGGSGGMVVYTCPSAPNLVGTPGNGGKAGSLYAGAGNGGPGGSGGDSTIFLGRGGDPGRATLSYDYTHNDFANGTQGAVGAVELSNGGNGGASGTSGVAAGNGGAVTISAGSLGAIIGADTYDHVKISNYSNGGLGASCPHLATHIAGTNGGGHAAPALTGMTAGQANLTITNAFNGGNGGDGTPPGAKGLAGTDKNGVKLGTDGTDGIPCLIIDPTSIAESEPNDETAQADPMGNATIATGSLSTLLDKDHFRISLSAGTYVFEISQNTGWINLWINPGGGVNVVNVPMQATVTLPPSATNYDVVWGVYGGSGSYKVTITKVL